MFQNPKPMRTNYQPILVTPVTQSGGQTQNNPIHSRWFALALGGCLFTSIFALSAASVRAGCQQYDVSGRWTIKQGSYSIAVTLSQNGKTVTGSAKQVWVADHQVRTNQGQVTGTIVGGEFDVQINWNGGGGGIYRGSMSTRDRLVGTTYDMRNMESTASWYTEETFKCAEAPSAGQTPGTPTRPPGYKPIKSSGKARPATTPAGNAATIKADPEVLVLGPGQTEGTVTLTWDAGPNPAAYVEESLDSKPGSVVARGATGTRQVTLKAGTEKAVFFLIVDRDNPPSRVAIAQVPVKVVNAAGSAGPSSANAADESSSSDTEDQHQKQKKHKKKKKHRHHDDDDQNQGND